MPPAPPVKAYTSPLIDMFNNPATATQSSEKISNSAGKRFSLISFMETYSIVLFNF